MQINSSISFYDSFKGTQRVQELSLISEPENDEQGGGGLPGGGGGDIVIPPPESTTTQELTDSVSLSSTPSAEEAQNTIETASSEAQEGFAPQNQTARRLDILA